MPVSPHDPRLEKFGFARLVGPGVDFYLKKYECVMGRKSKSTALDLVLGDNMNISRQHAQIVYNFDIKAWEIMALGKNGVDVNGTMVMPDTGPHILSSQDLVTIADREFHFLLPKTISNTKVSAGPKRRHINKQTAETRAKTPASSRGKRRKVATAVPPPKPISNDDNSLDAALNFLQRTVTSQRPTANNELVAEQHEQYASGEEQHQLSDEDNDELGQRPPAHPQARSFDEEMDEDDGYQDVNGQQRYNGHQQYGYDEDELSNGAEDEEDGGYEYDNGGYK